MSRYDDWKLTELEKKPMPKCPVCGSEAKEFYRLDGKIIGCDGCVQREPTSEYLDWLDNLARAIWEGEEP